eukprot:763174-Hanusia_phi.AAC.2
MGLHQQAWGATDRSCQESHKGVRAIEVINEQGAESPTCPAAAACDVCLLGLGSMESKTTRFITPEG